MEKIPSDPGVELHLRDCCIWSNKACWHICWYMLMLLLDESPKSHSHTHKKNNNKEKQRHPRRSPYFSIKGQPNCSSYFTLQHMVLSSSPSPSSPSSFHFVGPQRRLGQDLQPPHRREALVMLQGHQGGLAFGQRHELARFGR